MDCPAVTFLNGHYKILNFFGNETDAKLTTTRLGKEMAVNCCSIVYCVNKYKSKIKILSNYIQYNK